MGAASLAAPLLWSARVSAEARAASFNTDGIAWNSCAEGLDRAQDECMQVRVALCLTCRALSSDSFERRVGSPSRRLKFVSGDRPQQPELSQTSAPEGDDIPREMILSPEAVLQEALNSGRRDNRIFRQRKTRNRLRVCWHRRCAIQANAFLGVDAASNDERPLRQRSLDETARPRR